MYSAFVITEQPSNCKRNHFFFLSWNVRLALSLKIRSNYYCKSLEYSGIWKFGGWSIWNIGGFIGKLATARWMASLKLSVSAKGLNLSNDFDTDVNVWFIVSFSFHFFLLCANVRIFHDRSQSGETNTNPSYPRLSESTQYFILDMCVSKRVLSKSENCSKTRRFE